MPSDAPAPHWQPTDPTVVEPVAEPVSSLTPANLEEGLAIESLMADPKSAYWRGDDAAALQQRYIGLVRGELAGSEGPQGPPDEPDMDLPIEATRYDLQGLPIYDSPTRDIVDSFLPVAYESGIGAQKTKAALQWALNEPAPTPAAFRQWASKQGWSSKQIDAATDWHRKTAQRMSK